MLDEEDFGIVFEVDDLRFPLFVVHPPILTDTEQFSLKSVRCGLSLDNGHLNPLNSDGLVIVYCAHGRSSARFPTPLEGHRIYTHDGADADIVYRRQRGLVLHRPQRLAEAAASP